MTTYKVLFVKIKQQFEVARRIAEPMINKGTYRWKPSTLFGWVVRMACTDVGQGAWQQAKMEISAQSSLSQDVAETGLSETD